MMAIQTRSLIGTNKDGPLSIAKVAERAGTSAYEIRFKRLEQNGFIMRSGLTPTDIMHLNGDYTVWNTEGAATGASILAERLGMSVKDLMSNVTKMVKEKLYLNIVKLLMENEDKNYKYEKIDENLEEIILKGYKDAKPLNNRMKSLGIDFSTQFSLVGIGAPIHVYLPDVAKALKTECVIPQNAGVANAVGAVTGNIRGEETVVIKPAYGRADAGIYSCHTSVEKREFTTYDEALDWAKQESERLAIINALSKGAVNVRIIIDVKESSVAPNSSEGSDGENSILLETKVTAMATGMLNSREGKES